jgi:hypothetical protein
MRTRPVLRELISPSISARSHHKREDEFGFHIFTNWNGAAVLRRFL